MAKNIYMVYDPQQEEDFNVSRDICIRVDEGADLTTMFGAFIEFTKMVGYQEGSWEDVLESAYNNIVVDCYGAFDWATDAIYRY